MDGQPEDASRRTYLAGERTLLAWWRSGMAALAVAIGVGRLLPAVLDTGSRGAYTALGVGYAILGLWLVLYGYRRERAMAAALAEGRFEPLPARVVIALTGYLVALALATMALIVAA